MHYIPGTTRGLLLDTHFTNLHHCTPYVPAITFCVCCGNKKRDDRDVRCTTVTERYRKHVWSTSTRPCANPVALDGNRSPNVHETRSPSASSYSQTVAGLLRTVVAIGSQGTDAHGVSWSMPNVFFVSHPRYLLLPRSVGFL